MTIELISKIISTLGLSLDIIGAWLIALEVVLQFHGKKVDVTGGVLRTDYLGSNGTPVVAGQHTEKTKEYKQWEIKKYKCMWLGLIILTIGFLLQIISSWL